MSEQPRRIDLSNWPKTENGYFICAPEHPMPKGVHGAWFHQRAKSIGGRWEGCCDRYECKDCGTRWMDEGPD